MSGFNEFERKRGVAADAAIYAARARRLRLLFVDTVNADTGIVPNAAAIRRGSFAMAADGAAFIAPDEDDLSSIEGWLAAHASARLRLSVTTPQAIRAALTEVAAPGLLDDAINGLAARHPEFSARWRLTRGQVAGGVTALAMLAAGIAVAPGGTTLAVNMMAATLFFAVSALRFVAARLVRTDEAPPPSGADEATLPVYTVLVPLRGEADLAEDVVRAVLRLDWPRDKLDVKLLLEEGDCETIAAARRVVGGTLFEVVIVPAGAPRTKPRALSYALALVRGEFVTVYDAEDRPHPGQLRRAWETFRSATPDLACVQAALVIDNEAEGWLPALFATEYAALFDGLLPALAAFGMPVPLGGTSNHLRGLT